MKNSETGNMDPQKRSLILLWISKIWSKTTESFLELKDGRFFHHVLVLLEHTTTDFNDLEKDGHQLYGVKNFLEEHYGRESCICELLKFDDLINEQIEQEKDVEMELAKIAVFLLSIALFEQKGNEIIAAASLDLPVHFHSDIQKLVQSVIETKCTDSFCSSTIEDVLKSPSAPSEESSGPNIDDCPKSHAEINTPISQNLFGAKDDSTSPPNKETSVLLPRLKSTPKDSKMSVTYVSRRHPVESPLPLNVSIQNASFGISSPFRGLNISTSSASPLANFIQSPEVIQKILLKKKELELSKVKRELNNQIYLSEDLQITIKDNIDTIANRDADIEKLKMRVKELLCYQDANDELQELKPKLEDLEATVEKLNGKLLKLDYYKNQCHVLEKENSDQRDEMQQLHEEIKSVECENGEKKELLLANSQMEIQMKILEAHVTELNKSKASWEEERSVLRDRLDHLTHQNEQLQKDYDELHIAHEESGHGESMGIIVDLQLGELRAQVEELTQIRNDLEEQLRSVKESESDKENQLSEVNQQVEENGETIKTLETTLDSQKDQLDSLRQDLITKECLIDQMKGTVSDLNAKLEKEKTMADEQKACFETSLSEKMKKLSEITQQCTDYENQTITLHNELGEVKDTLVCEQGKNMELMSKITCKEDELTSINRKNENLLKEIENLTMGVDSLNQEKDNMSRIIADLRNDMSEKTQVWDIKEQELTSINLKNENLLREIESLTMKIESLIQEKDSMSRIIADLRNDMAGKTQEWAIKEQELIKTVEDMKQLLDEKENQITSLVNSLAMKKSTEEEMNMKISLREREISNMKNLINEKDIELEASNTEHSERISALDEKFKSVSSEKEMLSQNLEAKDVEIEELNQNLMKKEEHMLALQDEHAKINNDLKEHVRSVEDNLAATQQKLAHQTAENKLIEEKLSYKKEQSFILDELQSKLECTENEKESLSCQVDDIIREIESLKNLTAEKDTKLEEYIKELETVKEKSSDMLAQLEKRAAQVEQISSQNNDFVSERETLKCQILDLQSEIMSVKSNLNTKANEVCSLEEEKEKASKEISSLQSQIDLLITKEKETLDIHERAVSEFRAEVGGKSSLIMSLENQQVEYTQNSEQQLAASLGEIENCNKRIKDLEEEVSDLNNKIKEYEQEITDQRSENDKNCSVTDNKLKLLEEEKMELNEQLLAKNSEFEALNYKLEETICNQSAMQEKNLHLNTIVVDLESKVKLMEENCSGMVQQLQDKDDQSAILKESIVKKDEEIQQNNHNLSAYERSINELEEKLKVLEKEHDDVKCLLESKTCEIMSLQKMFEETQSKNKELGNQGEVIQSEKGVLEKKCDELSDEMNQVRFEMEESVESLKSQLVASNDENSTLKSDIQNKENEIQKLRSECEEKSVHLTETQTKVDTLLEGASTDRELMEDKLMEYSSQMANIETYLQEKEQEISAKMQEIANMTLKVNEQDNIIEELTRDLQVKGELEKTLENLESQLMASKGENSSLKSDIQDKENEIQKLHYECEEKSVHLTETQAKVESLLEGASSDRLGLENKLMEYSGQVSSIVADLQERKQEISAKTQEITNMTLRLSEQDETIEELIRDLQEAKLSLSEIMSLKEIAEKSKEEVVKELDEHKVTLNKLNAEVQCNEERQFELVQKLEEEVSRLQHQADVIDERDKQIKQLETEVVSLHDIKDNLNLKEQELSSLAAENQLLKEKHICEMESIRKQYDSTMLSILSYFKAAIENDEEENSCEGLESLCMGEEMKSVLGEALEEIKCHYQATKVDFENKIVKIKEETEIMWTEKMDRLNSQMEEERERTTINKEIELDKIKKETEAIWTKKLTDYQTEFKEEGVKEAARFEEELSQLRENITSVWKEKLEDVQTRKKADFERIEKEKELLREELNNDWQNALDDLQIKFESAKASEMKVLSQQKAEALEMRESFENQLTAQQNELKALKDENTKLMERETTHLKNSETQMKTANEYCNSLRKQLETATAKAKALEQELSHVRDQHSQQISTMKETRGNIESTLRIEQDTNAKLRQRMEGHMTKYNSSQMLLEKAKQENKNYSTEINKLRTSLDYSERKLQEYKNQLDHGSVYFGDDSHFQRIIQEHDNKLDDSVIPKEAHTPKYNLRSSNGSRQSLVGSPNETIITADTVMLKRDTLASSTELNVRHNNSPKERLSISSTSSSQSIRARNRLPSGVFSCADEPEEVESFNLLRLNELQRRNTLCLPHMKSSYPVETQRVKKEKFTDDSLRLSIIPSKKATLDDQKQNSRQLGKRKSPVTAKQTDETTTPKQTKTEISPGGTVIYFPLVKDGPVYPSFRPPTPGRQRRFIRTPGSSPHTVGRHKILGSTIARKKQHTPSPRKSPRLNPKSPRLYNIAEHENKVNESVTFNIGFTPDKSKNRKKGLKKSEANSDASIVNTSVAPKKGLAHMKQLMKEKVRKPLATRNYRETGI